MSTPPQHSSTGGPSPTTSNANRVSPASAHPVSPIYHSRFGERTLVPTDHARLSGHLRIRCGRVMVGPVTVGATSRT